jgi:hypothetical protein
MPVRKYSAGSRSLVPLLMALTGMAHGAVTSVSPSSDVLAGGATVVITGTSFGTATAVTFGGVNATSFVVDSATRITAVVPAGTLGKKDIVVNNGGGTGTNLFTYKTSTTAALVINVQCTIARILSIVWTANTQTGGSAQTEGATGALTWTLPAMVMNQIKTTVSTANDASYGTNGMDFEIRNAGNSTIALTGTVADTNGTNTWSSAAAAASNTYYMAYALTKDPASPTWTSLHASPVVNANMAIDGVQPFELKFQAPSALTVAADFGVQHVIAVTMTATAGP